jgi:trehalose/maltose hydrolase-like predicted phosphorylase
MLLSVLTGSAAAGSTSGPGSAAPGDPATGTGSYILTATAAGSRYAPPFTGNGELGVRVPPAGQGYAAGSVPSQCEFAGFYAQAPGGVQQRATIPTWSTLTYSDGAQAFAPSSGGASNWRQSIDLRTGVITTSVRWTAPDGHVTALSYEVLTDRARPDVGLVRLTLTPLWSGTATVTDAIDGTPATMSTQVDKGWLASSDRDWVTVRSVGTAIDVALASQLATSGDVHATVTPVDQDLAQSVGQQLSFPVTSGQTYTLTKYVGVVSAPAGSDPTAAAQAQSEGAADAGLDRLMATNDAAWASLWRGRIDIVGDPTLATEVNASEFALWSSTRDGVDWSIPPAGLSSDGYNGHVFWDAETWMYPALLAQHPDLAAGINAYRDERLAAAESHAAAGGQQGARFPWESALTGTEQIPPPASVFTEGLYELHITADVALAQWQYYLATGDKRWLATRGWPVISEAADFWASRVTVSAGGRMKYEIDGVTGPDEDNPDVDDDAYTNVAVRATLRDAIEAAHVLAKRAPADWGRIAADIYIPTGTAQGVTPEFDGYDGQLVKQADVTLLEYPWSDDLPPATAQRDINYYAPRTDPGGPSMSDAVNAIDTAELDSAGCATFVYTERSVQPFIHDVFDQFSETRTGGTLTFMTGIGGFLQEFLYGYSGLRWNASSVELAPTLTDQLGAVVLHDLSWHGRRFTVAIGRRTTTLTVQSGAALPVTTPSGRHTVAPGHSLTIDTRRPDLTPTKDEVRCGDASATSSQPGAPALAAVDGSPATDWQPTALPATLVAPLTGGTRTVGSATLEWGRQWPTPPALGVPPPPGPVTTLRASSYTLVVSTDDRTWHTVATVSDRTVGTTDVLHFTAVRARYIGVRIASSPGMRPPLLDELTVTP